MKRVVDSFGDHYQALRRWADVITGIAGDESQTVLRAGLNDGHIIGLNDSFAFDNVMISMSSTADENIIPPAEAAEVAEKGIAMRSDNGVSRRTRGRRVVKMSGAIQ